MMKWFEWLIAVLLIVMGLLCLTLSGMPHLHADFMGFVSTMIQLCFWMGIPVILLGLIYVAVLIVWRKHRKK